MQITTKYRNTVPGTYIALIADVVTRWNVTKEELLNGTGIEQAKLLEPMWHADFDQTIHIIDRALLLTKAQPFAFGFYLGMQMTVTCHGLIGFAALAAQDVHDALKIAQEFIALQSTIHKIKLNTDDEFAYLYFEQTTPYQYDEMIQTALLLGFVQMGQAISGHKLTGFADVQFERPEYFEELLHLLPGEVRFNQSSTRLVFNKQILEIPLPTADPITARLIREQCKTQLRNLIKHSTFSSLVQDLVYDEVLGISSITEICEKLQISERTMQRKLADEQMNFREIVEQVRRNKAIMLLRNHNLGLNYISDHLGYTNITNFSSAFKRWTGKSPRRYS